MSLLLILLLPLGIPDQLVEVGVEQHGHHQHHHAEHHPVVDQLVVGGHGQILKRFSGTEGRYLIW